MFPPPSPSTIIAGAAISLGFATTALILRFISRARIVGVVGAEDVFLVAALVLSACHVAGVVYQVRLGLGTGIETLGPERIVLFLKALFFSILCYVTGHTLTKISILCLYTRVFRTTGMRKVYPVMLALIAIHGLYLIFSLIFGCRPVRAFWDISLPRNCLPREPMWLSNAAANILTDFALFLSPLGVLKTSGLAKRQKIGLYFVFLLGLFVCLISLIRLDYLYYGAKATDITRDIAGVTMWSAVELNVAIVCASLMVMKPLVAHVFPRLFKEPDPPDSYPFSYVTPLTISDRGTAEQLRPPESTASRPQSQAVRSERDQSMENMTLPQGGAQHVHIPEAYLPR
ncbi:hypothetical protein QBC43DRAFT_289612 [Cladorrhinum sp. PSN259]|nr:hypothetical protein QBC43DRAFT_289612 [Cladorrhinum sp. PSN259]